MPEKTGRKILVFACAVLCALSLGGCVEFKYTTIEKLDGNLSLRSSGPVKTVYFSFPRLKRDRQKWGGYFSSNLLNALSARGFVPVDSPDQADIVLKAYPKFYTKQQGTFLIVFLLPTYRFTEEYDGLFLKIYFKTDKSRKSKSYKVYYRSWLDGDLELASDRIIKTAAGDIFDSLPR